MDAQTNNETAALPSCPRSAAGERLQAELTKLDELCKGASAVLEHLNRQYLEASRRAAERDREDHRNMLGVPVRQLLEADDVWREQTLGEECLLTEAERDVCHIINEGITRAERKCQAVVFDAEDMRDIDALFTKYAAAIECGPEYPSYSRTDGDPGEPDYSKMIGLMQEANKEGGAK